MGTSYGIKCPACKQESERHKPAREWAKGLIQAAWHLRRCYDLIDSMWFEPCLMGYGSEQIDFVAKHAACGVSLQVVSEYGDLIETVAVEVPSYEQTELAKQRMADLADVLALTASELNERLNEL
jgi:hypothetical protein